MGMGMGMSVCMSGSCLMELGMGIARHAATGYCGCRG